MNTEVLIVGAGPTGLMLANQLARRGVRMLIIDRHSGPALQTRALGVQARTLEIYAKLGLADRAIETGVAVSPWRPDGPVESACPIRHAAEVIGALWCRWGAGMPRVRRP